MYVTIKKMYNGTKVSQKGKEMEGLFIEGISHGYEDKPDKEYSKFFNSFFDAEIISKFSKFKPGDKVNIKYIQDKGFWKAIDVLLLEPSVTDVSISNNDFPTD